MHGFGVDLHIFLSPSISMVSPSRHADTHEREKRKGRGAFESMGGAICL